MSRPYENYNTKQLNELAHKVFIFILKNDDDNIKTLVDFAKETKFKDTANWINYIRANFMTLGKRHLPDLFNNMMPERRKVLSYLVEVFVMHVFESHEKLDEFRSYYTPWQNEDLRELLASYNLPTKPEEPIMLEKEAAPTMSAALPNCPTIEQRTYIRGRNAAELSDQVIYNFIRELENEISHLKTIKKQPEKLKKLIIAKENEVIALADFVDERN